MKVFCLFLLVSVASAWWPILGSGEGTKTTNPIFLGEIQNQTVSEGRAVKFGCRVDNLGSHKVAWIHYGNAEILTIANFVMTRNQRITVSHDEHQKTWFLHINDVRETDSGKYKCMINTASGMTMAGYLTVVAASIAKKQLDILHLLHKVTEPLHFADLKDAAEHFDPNADHSNYKDGGAAAEALTKEIDDHKVLVKHHWFSLFNGQHRHEALQLFDVLMNCKSWGCVINNAAYFRERVNEGVFVYALYVAVIHHPVTANVVLPPLYEIIPHLFTNSEIIRLAYSAKMKQTPGKFHMNYTGSKKNPEQRVAYFSEDIGLLVNHVTWHMYYPFWWEDKYGPHLDRKGELFIWAHYQLTTRFDAERLSNHLDVVDELYWDRPIANGFVPLIAYKYGGEFPSRPDNKYFEDVDGVARIRDMIVMGSRIRDAIAHGYIIAKDGSRIDIRNEKGIVILGDIIEASAYSPNVEYYGALHNIAHIVLSRQGDPHGKFNHPPGVLEHFETTTRDPAFFRLHKYIGNIIKEHKDSLPPYTKDDLDFEGVDVDSVSIDGKLETFFEPFIFSLINAVDDAEKVEDVDISAIINRLNHEAFSLNIDITNNNKENTFATIRIQLCPRRDANGIIFSLNEGRWHCVELDKFWRTLAPGKNHVVRKSSDASTTVPDLPSYQTLLEKTNAAISSGSELDLSEFSRSCGIPNRLLLPKGNTEGMEFALIVIVSDGSKDAAVEGLENDERGGSHAQCGIHGETYPDKRPLGFPLDRRIPNERAVLSITNIKKLVVTITHRDDLDHSH